MVTNRVILPEEHKLGHFLFVIPGITNLTITEFEDLGDKIRTAIMPDQTRRTSGTTEGGESNLKIPQHHAVEVAAMDTYLELCRVGAPLYKRDWTVTYFSTTGISQKGYMLVGGMLTGRMLPGGKIDDEGNPALVQYSFSWDEIVNL